MFDELVKSRNFIEFVIPAKAGIQLFQDVLDPGFRRGDAPRDFLRDHQCLTYLKKMFLTRIFSFFPSGAFDPWIPFKPCPSLSLPAEGKYFRLSRKIHRKSGRTGK
jgi:hypothetical protein